MPRMKTGNDMGDAVGRRYRQRDVLYEDGSGGMEELRGVKDMVTGKTRSEPPYADRRAAKDRQLQAAREAMSRVEGKTDAKRKLPIPGRMAKKRMPRKSSGLTID